ncbi:tannase/feruloyl esterase family alpha/beta hydrolase [Amycolatopsis suaedae]|uniref:Tannase/feruloyl esterase family alpha/beta hydrolase n=1 Tax=Amycolatopsis suaedae TaxID=2510978 RepID=A0A4Q7JE94_9PSEU|nr:tannase/feruloyl esterase family alpha/beta hydrolase [Amycolatopsis suaedae]
MTILIGCAALLSPVAPAVAESGALRPVRTCADLERTFDVPHARTTVTSATEVSTGPAHCEVRGVIEPAVRFTLRLPLDTFFGRYLQYGCGGLCGTVPNTPFPDCGPKAGDVAVAATDDGHVGEGGELAFTDGRWARDNQAARDDYFFRAPHVLSKAAKRIIAEFYGAPPRTSYFSGCSNGGREALILAQRYPDDFDGIIAGAPALHFSSLAGVYQTWLHRTNHRADGTPIIGVDKLPVLHSAVVSACDGLDGRVDQQIDDPRKCTFDPASIQCPDGDGKTCLTADQVAVARELYRGPVDSHGRRLYPGSQTRGSELAWAEWGVADPAIGSSVAGLLADNALRHVSFPIGRPHSSLADFRLDTRDFSRLAAEGVKANAMNTDLSGFRRSGGKLIIWHGWDDQAIPAAGTLDYYQRLWERSGGLRATQQWARLFMVPTMAHCSGGYQLQRFDPFRELVSWVERGTAPERIVATGKRSEPVFPYPRQSDGRPRDVVRWVGEGLYHRPGPVAP